MTKEIIDCNNMLPGDIILTRNKFAAISFAIRLFTWSKFSHAAIYIGNTTICEAIASGVHTKNIVRWSLGLKDNCKVLRHANSSAGDIAAELSTTYLGTRYGYIDAILSELYRLNIVTPPRRISPSRMFCSRLIAEVYETIGQNICNIDPYLVRPKDISNSNILIEVPIKYVDQPPLPKTDYTLLFEQAVEKLVKEFIKILRRHHIKTKQLVGISSILLIINELRNKELDKQIAQVLKDSDYYNLHTKEMHENIDNWDVTNLFNSYINHQEIDVNKIQELIGHHASKVNQYTSELTIMENSGLKGFTFDAFYTLNQKLKEDSSEALHKFQNALNYILAH